MPVVYPKMSTITFYSADIDLFRRVLNRAAQSLSGQSFWNDSISSETREELLTELDFIHDLQRELNEEFVEMTI